MTTIWREGGGFKLSTLHLNLPWVANAEMDAAPAAEMAWRIELLELNTKLNFNI